MQFFHPHAMRLFMPFGPNRLDDSGGLTQVDQTATGSPSTKPLTRFFFASFFYIGGSKEMDDNNNNHNADHPNKDDDKKKKRSIVSSNDDDGDNVEMSTGTSPVDSRMASKKYRERRPRRSPPPSPPPEEEEEEEEIKKERNRVRAKRRARRRERLEQQQLQHQVSTPSSSSSSSSDDEETSTSSTSNSTMTPARLVMPVHSTNSSSVAMVDDDDPSPTKEEDSKDGGKHVGRRIHTTTTKNAMDRKNSLVRAKQQALYYQSILPPDDTGMDGGKREKGSLGNSGTADDDDDAAAMVVVQNEDANDEDTITNNNDDDDDDIENFIYPGAVAVQGINSNDGRWTNISFLYDTTTTTTSGAAAANLGTRMTMDGRMEPIRHDHTTQDIPPIVHNDDDDDDDEDDNAIRSTTEDVVAIVVDRDQLEQEFRDQIHMETVQATKVKVDNDKYFLRSATIAICLLYIIMAITSVTIGLTRRYKGGGSGRTDDDYHATNTSAVGGVRPALQSVIVHDVVTCGISEKDRFGYIDETTGRPEGFEVDLCRAMAAMVLHDPDKIRTKFLTGLTRFQALANGTVDILTYATTHTMSRDVNELRSNQGFTFTVPYLYDGIQFGGHPDYVQCADDHNMYGNCSDLSICISSGTTDWDILSSQFPNANLQPTPSSRVLEGFVRGECNVLSGESWKISELLLREAGYEGPYGLGRQRFTKEPLSMVTRQGDPEWAHYANTIIQALLAGEKLGLTQEAARLLLDSSSSSSSSSRIMEDDDSFDARLVRVVAAVGNYAEMYQRHLENIVPRSSQNLLNNGTSGLILAHPFANIGTSVSSPVMGGYIEKILARGHLVCGIRPGRPGFATASGIRDANGESGVDQWTGLDADYCRAVSSALFGSFSDTLKFVPVLGNYTFEYDDNDGIDLVAGAMQDYQLGISNSFSQPYYYDPNSNDSLSLMTPSDDAQWSDFVHWIVAATFYAEEKHIHRFDANLMPEVYLFGPQLVRMFRDVILQVGDYGEMYFRNVQELEPRRGRNMLNANPYGPQHYVPFDSKYG